jgi:predicted ATPase with chaperone activity
MRLTPLSSDVEAGLSTDHHPAYHAPRRAYRDPPHPPRRRLTGARTAWVTTRPCRAPYHTISDAGLIGGGQVPMPGDVSLAHNGMLFLDARPEFPPSRAQGLAAAARGEHHTDTISRTSWISTPLRS